MKIFSLRNILALAIVVVLIANVFRWRQVKAEEAQEQKLAAIEAEKSAGGNNLLPSPGNLLAMGVQWQDRIQALPPEQRKEAEKKFEDVKKRFVEVLRLPPEEKKVRVKEILNDLMNDPEMQAEWSEGRHKMLANLTPEQRHDLIKNYVQYKKTKTQQ